MRMRKRKMGWNMIWAWASRPACCPRLTRTNGHGSGFAYPPSVIEAVDSGQTVGEAMTQLTGIQDIGQKGGAIGHLTRDLLRRRSLTEQAVLMAFIPRIRQELYR